MTAHGYMRSAGNTATVKDLSDAAPFTEVYVILDDGEESVPIPVMAVESTMSGVMLHVDITDEDDPDEDDEEFHRACVEFVTKLANSTKRNYPTKTEARKLLKEYDR